MKGTITVSYYTEDGSAKAGLHYESISGEVTFKDDEFRQSIRVSTVASPYWSPTLVTWRWTKLKEQTESQSDGECEDKLEGPALDM